MALPKPLFLTLLVLLLAPCAWATEATSNLTPKAQPPLRVTPLPANVDFSGFWKTNCGDDSGVDIEKVDSSTYSICFCGPGGCFKPGEWTPNSRIIGDSKYRILGPDTIQFPFDKGFISYHRCKGREPDPHPQKFDDSQDTAKVKIKYADYDTEKLQDFETNPPFNHKNKNLDAQLRVLLAKAELVKPYVYKKRGRYFELKSNVKKDETQAIQLIVGKLAPSLKTESVSIWKTDLNGDGEPELIVCYDYLQHIDPHNTSLDEAYHYLNVWLLRWEGGKYGTYYVGPFLFGRLFDVFRFGPYKTQSVVIQHQNCFECDPTKYLSVFYLDPQKHDFVPFKFVYDLNHKESDDTMEYDLPGMGHTIDADVECRIPDEHGIGKPCLIQHYIMLNCDSSKHDPDEWWIFKCQGFRCDHEMFHELPEKYKNVWEHARSLGLTHHECD